MTWFDWLLFLHVTAAFVTVAGVVFFGALLLGTWRTNATVEALPLLRLSRLAEALWNVGGLTVLIFGVWLAVYVDGYELWDAWIVAALVLWLIASGAGSRVARYYREAVTAGAAEGDAALAATVRSQRSLALHAVMAISVAALFVVMIYKPGA